MGVNNNKNTSEGEQNDQKHNNKIEEMRTNIIKSVDALQRKVCPTGGSPLGVMSPNSSLTIKGMMSRKSKDISSVIALVETVFSASQQPVKIYSLIDIYLSRLLPLYGTHIMTASAASSSKEGTAAQQQCGKIHMEKDVPTIHEDESALSLLSGLISFCCGNRKGEAPKKLYRADFILNNALRMGLVDKKASSGSGIDRSSTSSNNMKPWESTLFELQLHFYTALIDLLFTSYSQWVEAHAFRDLADPPVSAEDEQRNAAILAVFQRHTATVAEVLESLTNFALGELSDRVQLPDNHLARGHMLAVRGAVRAMMEEDEEDTSSTDDDSEKRRTNHQRAEQEKSPAMLDLNKAKLIYTHYRYDSSIIDEIIGM